MGSKESSSYTQDGRKDSTLTGTDDVRQAITSGDVNNTGNRVVVQYGNQQQKIPPTQHRQQTSSSSLQSKQQSKEQKYSQIYQQVHRSIPKHYSSLPMKSQHIPNTDPWVPTSQAQHSAYKCNNLLFYFFLYYLNYVLPVKNVDRCSYHIL